MTKENRNNRRWREDEDSALMTMIKNGARPEEMAASLCRTASGIKNRVHKVRSTEKLSTEAFLPTVVKMEKAETDLSLLLWFVKEAWVEGHTIVIPSLGATFRKDEA